MADISGYLRAKLDKFKEAVMGRAPIDVVSNNRAVMASPRARATLPQTQALIRQANVANVERFPVTPVQGSRIPRFNIAPELTQNIQSPVLRNLARFSAEIPNELANIPTDIGAGTYQYMRGAQKLGYNLGQRYAGQPATVADPLRETFSGAGRLGLGAFNLVTAGKAPAAKQATTQLLRTGLKPALSQGAKVGARYGATAGALQGAIGQEGDTLPKQLLRVGGQTLAGTGLGLVLGAGAAAAPSVFGAPFRAFLKSKAQRVRPKRKLRVRPTGRAAQIDDDAVDALRGLRSSDFVNARGNVDLDLYGKVQALTKRANRASGLNRAERTQALQLLNQVYQQQAQAGFVRLPGKGKISRLPAADQERLADLEMQLAGLDEAIDSHPAKDLTKFMSKTGEFAGGLKEVTGKGESQFARIGDDVASELGFPDTESARKSFGEFMELQQIREELLEEARTLANKARTLPPEGKTRLPSQVTKQGYITVPARANQLLVTSQTTPPAGTPGQSRLLATSRAGRSGTGTRTPSAPATVGQSLTPPPSSPARPYSDIIKNSRGITPQEKVGIFDLLRTPDRVLQKIGLGREADLIRTHYNKYIQELPREIERVSQWAARVPGKDSSAKIFRYLDGNDVQLSPAEFQVAQEVKQYLSQWANRLGLPQDKRIANYITHIFDQDFIQKEFDPDLAKILRTRVAGSVYDPFLEKRLGKMGYVEDAWRALDAYVKRATRKANMDPALAKVKEAAKNLEESQYKYIKDYVDRVNLRPTDRENLLDNSVKQVFGYRFGVRPTIHGGRKVRNWVYRGSLGLNVGSAIRNLTQGVNTYATLGEKYTIIGYSKLVKRLVANDLDELYQVGVLSDNIIQDRKLSAVKGAMEKLDKGLWAMFDMAEKINRGAAYFGAKAKAVAQGASEEEAVKQALKIVRDTQFTFGSIDTPPVLQSEINKVLLQFQSFNIKQAEFLIEMIGRKDLAGIARFTGANVLIIGTIGQALGYDYLDAIPFSGVLTGETKLGATPPVQLAATIGKALTGAEDKYGEPVTLEDVGSAFIPFIPGGVQGKKTIQGLKAINQGYSSSNSGRARFPVTNEIQSALLGQYSSPVARFYFDNKLSPLSDKDTATLKEKVATGADPKQAYYELFRGQMARSEKAPEEKERLMNGMREVLGIQDVSASEAAVPASPTDRKESLTKAKELLRSDIPEAEKMAGLQQLGVVGTAGSGSIGSLFFWQDEDGDYRSADLGKYNQTLASPSQQLKQEKEMFSDVAKVLDSTVPESIKLQALNQIGVSESDGTYFMAAREAADVRGEFVKEYVAGVPHEQLLETLSPLRRQVGGKMVLTNGIIDDLYNDGVITIAEKKYLKSLEYNRTTKKVEQKLKPKNAKKPKQLTIRQVSAARVPKVASVARRKTRKLKRLKIRVPQSPKLPQPKALRVETVEDFKKRLLAKR